MHQGKAVFNSQVIRDGMTATENALAIKLCLDYLEREARDLGLAEVAEMISLASLSAEEATRAVRH